MINKESMYETFQKMYRQDKHTILSKLGTPDISYNAFVAYHKSHMWMVLFFKDVRTKDSFKSELQSATFFDENCHLLWSSGIQLFNNVDEAINNHPAFVDEFIMKYGTPHAQMGGMQSSLQYLTDDGRILVVKYNQNQIVSLCGMKISDLA